MSLLRQVSLFTSDHSSAVRFTFTAGELHLTAMSGGIGEGKVSMTVNYGGPKLDIAFNPHYFLDICAIAKTRPSNFLERCVQSRTDYGYNERSFW